jgi:hypothetical protein
MHHEKRNNEIKINMMTSKKISQATVARVAASGSTEDFPGKPGQSSIKLFL